MRSINKIHLNGKQIESIAEELECGLRCFYNLKTKEIISLIDREEMPEIIEEIERQWDDIEQNENDYLEFEKMASDDAFLLMEKFTNQIKDKKIKDNLIKALTIKRPFANFKIQIEKDFDLRQKWFDFKKEKMIEWVRNQIE